MQTTTEKLAEYLKARLAGRPDRIISGVSGIDMAHIEDITFATDDKQIKKLQNSAAGAVIIERYLEGLSMTQIIVDDVHKSLVRVLGFFAPRYPAALEGVDALASVGKDVRLGAGVSIGPYVVLEDNCSVGDYTMIAPGCRIGRNSQIGDHSQLDNHVVVYPDCTIGRHVILQANVVIGSTGFGYYFYEDAHHLIPHIGTVIIEDFVEIGANSCVDRAKFDATIIGAGTKIDNLVQIGHNVVIGKCCIIAGMVGISGSCRLGDGVVIGGKVGLRDHMTLGAGSMVGGGAMVWDNVPPGKKVFGYPARDQRTTLRLFSLIERLPDLYARVRRTEDKLQKSDQAALL